MSSSTIDHLLLISCWYPHRRRGDRDKPALVRWWLPCCNQTAGIRWRRWRRSTGGTTSPSSWAADKKHRRLRLKLGADRLYVQAHPPSIAGPFSASQSSSCLRGTLLPQTMSLFSRGCRSDSRTWAACTARVQGVGVVFFFLQLSR